MKDCNMTHPELDLLRVSHVFLNPEWTLIHADSADFFLQLFWGHRKRGRFAQSLIEESLKSFVFFRKVRDIRVQKDRTKDVGNTF